MKLTQYYETEVLEIEGDLGIRMVVVPVRSYGAARPMKAAALAELLGLERGPEIKPGYLVRAVVGILAQPSAASPGPWPDLNDFGGTEVTSRHYEFAEYMISGRVVPFESSPLSAESLGNLISTAGGVGLGAYVGFAASGGTPLVFVLVPAGMILFGAAAGVARGLEDGLRDRIATMIRGRKGASA